MKRASLNSWPLGARWNSGPCFEVSICLPGAASWSFENGQCHKGKYFSPEMWESQPTLTAEAFQSRLQETFKRILPRYLESDSKIGISLTAGVDSRMIMACLPQTRTIRSAIPFQGRTETHWMRDWPPAWQKHAAWNTKFCALVRDFFSDFASHVDRTVYATDGALGSLGAHEIYLNNQARVLSPVRLTGVFGGEILRGVSMFKPLHFAQQLLNAELGRDHYFLHNPVVT